MYMKICVLSVNVFPYHVLPPEKTASCQIHSQNRLILLCYVAMSLKTWSNHCFMQLVLGCRNIFFIFQIQNRLSFVLASAFKLRYVISAIIWSKVAIESKILNMEVMSSQITHTEIDHTSVRKHYSSHTLLNNPYSTLRILLLGCILFIFVRTGIFSKLPQQQLIR
jgi:hypothetical protein